MRRPRKPERIDLSQWGSERVETGQSKDVLLDVSESYSGMTVRIPLHVKRGEREGPAVFVTAALHGNEINGTGAIRSLILDDELHLDSGTLVLVPVVNVLGFERHSRYLPDRRDLNRCFPGSQRGSLASRFAYRFFREVVRRCDYGVDLHTAAVRRTNFPNVRSQLSDPAVARLAKSFGCEIIVDNTGPKGSLRFEACRSGCPTIVFEGGEVLKVQSAIVQCCIRGIKNLLAELEMADCPYSPPAYSVTVKKTKWVRAENGGFLRFHVVPGDIVEKNQPIATNTSLLGKEQNVLTAPFDGIVLGMTTLPAVSPGEPVCHVARVGDGIDAIKQLRRELSDEHLHERTLGDLATNFDIVDSPQT